tara:strand:+ start:763 stop:1104 length:342 start_codon:yes stop_codon:yes gene_type:complete
LSRVLQIGEGLFFNDEQKRKVELYALIYVAVFLLPFPISLHFAELAKIGGILLWLIASVAYMVAYLRVVSELPKKDRVLVTWNQSTYLPQVIFKVAPVLIFMLVWLILSTVWY